MIRRHPFANLLALILCATLALTQFAAGPKPTTGPEDPEDDQVNTKADDDDAPKTDSAKKESTSWHKVKTGSGTLKQKEVLVKFQPTTARFRVKFAVAPTEGASYTQVRAYLMMETVRDVDGKPVNWVRREVLIDGNRNKGDEIEREFDGGLDKDGKPKWFAVSVTGYGGKYEVLAEDHAAGATKSSKKKKSKKEE